MLSTSTLLLGPAKSGKTERVLEIFAAEQRKHAATDPLQTILVLPSRVDIERAKARLNSRGLAFFSAGIMTLDGLAKEILDTHQTYPAILNDAERAWLLRQILLQMESEKKLRFLKGLADNRGFLRELAGFVKELKHAEIFYPKLKEALRRKGPEPKDDEILEIYKRYQNDLVRKNVYDEEGLLWHAKAQLDREKIHTPIETALIDGFDSFTPTELAFLQSFARNAASVTITLTLEKDPAKAALFAVAQKTRECLQRLLPLREEWILADNARTSARTAPAVTLSSAGDIAAEARLCAQQIKRLLAAGATNAHAIAVCVRNLETYKNNLIRAFEREGLPHNLDAQRNLAGTPVCCFLLSFLDAHASPTLTDMLRVMSSPLLAPTLAARGLPDGDWILRAFQEGHITDLVGDWKTRLRWALKERLPKYPEALDALPEKFEEIATAFEQWPKMQTVAAHLQSFRALLTAWGVGPKALDGLSLRGHAVGAEWDVFWDALNDFALASRRWRGAQSPIALAQLREEIIPFIERARVRRTVTHAGIAVLEAEQFRGACFGSVFILGVNEGVFPSTSQRHTLYSVAERRKMIAAGLEIAEEEDIEAQESLLFHQVLSSAQKSLYVSYAHSMPTKKECLPSPYFLDLCRVQGIEPQRAPAFAGIPGASPGTPQSWTCREDALGAWSQHLFAPKSRRPALFYEIEKKWDKENPQEIQHLKRRAAVERRRERGMNFSSWDAQIQDPSLLAEISAQFGLGSVTSASKLNEYASCPFRFYARYVFGMDPQSAPTGELSAMLRGTLVHDILWRLYHARFQTTRNPAAQEALAAIEKDMPGVATDVFRGLEQTYGILRQGIWEWEKNRLLARLKDFLAHDQASLARNPLRKPAYFELAFGMPAGKADQDTFSAQAPLVLLDQTEKLRVRGKIDRLDLEQFHCADGKTCTGFWVLDYKTGGRACSKSEIRKGKEVQLPIYVLAAQQLLEKLGLEAFAAGASLYSTWPPHDQKNFHKSKKALAAGDDDEEWEEILQEAAGHLFGHARGISAGRFTPTPFAMKCVAGCKYRSTCRFDERRIENKRRTLGPANEEDSE